MSDRLAISATFSVMMMSLYVLFGANSARMPLDGATLETPAALSAPARLSGQEQVSTLFD